MKTTDFAKYIKSFIAEYLPIERNLSVNTVRAYRDTFVLLIRFLENEKGLRIDKIKINQITKSIVLEFLKWLRESRNSSHSTINARLAAIQTFFKYIADDQFEFIIQRQKISSIPIAKTQKKVFEYLSLSGIKLLLEQINTQTKRGRRDLALLCLLYDTGARVQEIIDLTPSAINFNKPYTIKLKGKGNKYRIVPLLDAEMNHLKDYLHENNLIHDSLNHIPLFRNSRKQKLTRAGVNYILTKYVKKARDINPDLMPSKISCHSIRHSKAMHLLQAELPLIYIRDLLGHVSVTTTEIYAKADSRQKRIALEKAYVEIYTSDQESQWEGDNKLISWLNSF
ncbi:site-specific integrase [Flavobacterium sp. DG1-102-2]|uniref:site-specific integrase n=1 Tax=Flavobacterium sp. DG1-102-2 TaxID=3081663 RepID=UPI002949F56C|nr:site-specific integrase [Flavobacterium sp. DG1-102-2]MDV6167118.1 site-specific integrase [Flavobacterium sp. DG1-102-2]